MASSYSIEVASPLDSEEVTNASGSTTAPPLDSSNAEGAGPSTKERRLSELSSVSKSTFSVSADKLLA